MRWRWWWQWSYFWHCLQQLFEAFPCRSLLIIIGGARDDWWSSMIIINVDQLNVTRIIVETKWQKYVRFWFGQWFFSENLFCIDNNDVIDDDNNVYIISIFNCLYFYIFSDSQFCFDDGRGGGKEVWMVVVAF